MAEPRRAPKRSLLVGFSEVLIPAGYVTTVYDSVFKLSADAKRYLSAASDKPTTIPEPGLPFSLVFRAEPGKEDVLLKIASTYEVASKRRISPPAFGPLAAEVKRRFTSGHRAPQTRCGYCVLIAIIRLRV